MHAIRQAARELGTVQYRDGNWLLVTANGGRACASMPAERHAGVLDWRWASSAGYLTGPVRGIMLIRRGWRQQSSLADDRAEPVAAAHAS
jgi:hypothetical protein